MVDQFSRSIQSIFSAEPFFFWRFQSPRSETEAVIFGKSCQLSGTYARKTHQRFNSKQFRRALKVVAFFGKSVSVHIDIKVRNLPLQNDVKTRAWRLRTGDARNCT